MLDGRRFDYLQFEVTALTDKDWEELKSIWEGSSGIQSPNFDQEAHKKEHELRKVMYFTEYWFDISSFYNN